MICSLLLLYARDSDSIKNDLLEQFKSVPKYCVCVDDPKVIHHEALKDPVKSRLQIVFFSPGFLSFLECRPEEAYSSFRNLDPQSTVALFCCGLRETEVMCYHTAPLKSFYSWPKFETSRDEGSQNRFSSSFLEMIKDIFPDDNLASKEIIITPEFINKESVHIYVIFKDVIQNIQDLSVQLESSSCIQINPETVNPYVLRITVPETLSESCEAFTIKIQQSDLFLVQKLIKFVKDEILQENVPQNDYFLKRSTKIVELEEQLQVLKDIGGISYLETLEEDHEEKEKTVLPSSEDMAVSLRVMCKKYGLEALSAFIDEPQVSVADACISGFCPAPLVEQHYRNEDPGVQQDVADTADNNINSGTAPVDDTDGTTGIIRSMSLPTILPPQEENYGRYGDYLPMGIPCIRPRFNLLTSSDGLSVSESNLSSNTYVTMKRHSGIFEGVTTELTGSQEDLLKMMHAFKSGQVTLFDVEKRFQQWQEKHNPQHRPSVDIEREDMPLFPGVLKRQDRKLSDASENAKRFSGSSSQSRLSSSDTWRKFSTTSISSSNSSKASDANSVLTLQSKKQSFTKKLPREISTGWIPAYSTTRCPYYPKTNPPPLPTRPRPPSKSRTSREEISNSRGSSKRKAGTYVPPITNDLISKNEDSKTDDPTMENSLEPLIQICEKYGLGNLSEYFFNELNQNKDADTKTENPENSPKKEANEFLNQSCQQLPLSEWDPENTSSFRRSLSLPSTLLQTETHKEVKDNTGDIPNAMPRCQADFQESVISKCEEYINSIQSNIYTSIQNYISMQNQHDFCQTNIMSVSQRELLEIINAFKKGEKTISQVENQFQEWHMRHMETSSRREQQLLQMKDQYVKAQKSNTFGIKKFILGRPRNRTPKTSIAGIKSSKRDANKAERDSKRLSKSSYTSTSSGVSDTSEVFKNMCFFNPGYGETMQEVSRINLPKTKLSSSSPEFVAPPPPLPPRPTLMPVSVMKWAFSEDDVSDISEAEKSPAKSTSSSPLMSVKQKPSPPPKPVNLFKKFSGSRSVDFGNNQVEEKSPQRVPQHNNNNNEEQAEVTRPESPDYIIPNKVRATSKKKLQSTKSKDTLLGHPQQCPVRFQHVCAKTTTMHPSGTYPLTNSNLKASKSKEKTAISNSKTKQTENSSLKRQLLLIPTPRAKSKKEESMFYITRRCSSVPDLQSTELRSEHVYLDLQELWDNRNRSISESNSPLE